MGASQLKARLLAALGWRTVSVPHAALERLRCEPHAFEQYLYRLIHRRAVPLRRPPLPSNLPEAERRRILRLVDELVGAGVPEAVPMGTGLMWGRGRGRSLLLSWVWAMADRDVWHASACGGTVPPGTRPSLSVTTRVGPVEREESEVHSQGDCAAPSDGDGVGSPVVRYASRSLVNCNDGGNPRQDVGDKAVQARDGAPLPEQGCRMLDGEARDEGSRMRPAVRQAVRKYSRGLLSRKGLVLAAAPSIARSGNRTGQAGTGAASRGPDRVQGGETAREGEEAASVAKTGTQEGHRW